MFVCLFSYYFGKRLAVNLSHQMVCCTEPFVKALIETGKRTLTFKKYFVSDWMIHQINSRRALAPVEQLGKSNSYRSQSRGDQKHFFNRKKLTVLFLALLSI